MPRDAGVTEQPQLHADAAIARAPHDAAQPKQVDCQDPNNVDPFDPRPVCNVGNVNANPNPNPNQHRVQHHPCTAPTNGHPPVCAPYGAPPPRRRVV